MSDFTVSINDLKVKVDTLRQLNAQFKSQVGELEATEANLNGMWEGEAKDTFHNAFTSDKTTISIMQLKYMHRDWSQLPPDTHRQRPITWRSRPREHTDTDNIV